MPDKKIAREKGSAEKAPNAAEFEIYSLHFPIHGLNVEAIRSNLHSKEQGGQKEEQGGLQQEGKTARNQGSLPPYIPGFEGGFEGLHYAERAKHSGMEKRGEGWTKRGGAYMPLSFLERGSRALW